MHWEATSTVTYRDAFMLRHRFLTWLKSLRRFKMNKGHLSRHVLSLTSQPRAPGSKLLTSCGFHVWNETIVPVGVSVKSPNASAPWLIVDPTRVPCVSLNRLQRLQHSSISTKTVKFYQSVPWMKSQTRPVSNVYRITKHFGRPTNSMSVTPGEMCMWLQVKHVDCWSNVVNCNCLCTYGE